jgi:hypothetical protein
LPQDEPESEIPDDLRLTAVGRIVGGLVHDANNALAVVVWNVERASRSLPADGKAAQSANTAIDSAMKAAGLLQRVLQYGAHSIYDPDLVNMDEMLSRLFVEASSTVEGNVAIHRNSGRGIGPVMADETLFELSLLDLIAVLSRQMKRGSITLQASDVAADATASAKILLSLQCNGIAAAHLPPLDATLLQHFARLAGAELETNALAGESCEIRLLLPRATASGGGEVFA